MTRIQTEREHTRYLRNAETDLGVNVEAVSQQRQVRQRKTCRRLHKSRTVSLLIATRRSTVSGLRRNYLSHHEFSLPPF